MSDNTTGTKRPQVLEDATETQIEELERQFEEMDKDAWKVLTDSYGWTADMSQAVWDWFGQSPVSNAEKDNQTTGSGDSLH